MKATVSESALFAAVNGCKEACANKSTVREDLKCVELRVQAEELIVTALDGHIILERRVDATDCEEGACLVDPATLTGMLNKDGVFVNIFLAGRELQCETASGKFTVKTNRVERLPFKPEWWNNDRHTHKVAFNLDYVVQIMKGLKQGKNNTVVFSFNPDKNTDMVFIEGGGDGNSRAILNPLRIIKHVEESA